MGRIKIPLLRVPAAHFGTVIRRNAPGHSPPRDGGEGVPPQTGLGEIPLYRLEKPQRGGVIVVASGISVFAQERKDQVVVLLREPPLLLRQGRERGRPSPRIGREQPALRFNKSDSGGQGRMLVGGRDSSRGMASPLRRMVLSTLANWASSTAARTESRTFIMIAFLHSPLPKPYLHLSMHTAFHCYFSCAHSCFLLRNIDFLWGAHYNSFTIRKVEIWRSRSCEKFLMKNAHPYAGYFVEHVHPSQMNVMGVCLTLCVKDVRGALTMDF